MNSLDTEQKADVVVEKLTESQSALYSYIYSLTADSNLAWDVLQDTNRLLWKKASEYDPEQDFLTWARAFAYNQFRTTRKKCQRDRLVFQDESTLRQISNEWDKKKSHAAGEKTIALEHCLATLPADQRDLIDRFYSNGETIIELSSQLGRKANSIAVTLYRIRQTLARCIRGRLRKNG